MHGGSLPYDPDDYLLRVDKNVYGDADSGRIWFDSFSDYLLNALGFTQSMIDRCAFRRATPGLWTI